MCDPLVLQEITEAQLECFTTAAKQHGYEDLLAGDNGTIIISMCVYTWEYLRFYKQLTIQCTHAPPWFSCAQVYGTLEEIMGLKD